MKKKRGKNHTMCECTSSNCKKEKRKKRKKSEKHVQEGNTSSERLVS